MTASRKAVGRRALVVLLSSTLLACGAPRISVDAAGDSRVALEPDAGTDVGPVCPEDGLGGRGRHRLFVQGHEAAARPDGTWPFLHERAVDGADAPLCDDAVFVNDTSGDGLWQPGEEPRPLGPSGLVHGEHFLVGSGAFVEISTTLCDDINGDVVLYIPNFDQDGSVSLHELLVVHADGRETLVAEAVDDEPGFSGYSPFVRVIAGNDPDVVPGDRLVLRLAEGADGEPGFRARPPPRRYPGPLRGPYGPPGEGAPNLPGWPAPVGGGGAGPRRKP